MIWKNSTTIHLLIWLSRRVNSLSEKITIVTDSTGDVTNAQLQASGIHRVPLSILFEDEEYLDWETLSPEQFYKKLQASPHFPTTAQPAPGRFLHLFQKLQKEGFTHILCVHISRKLSGTVQSASVAAKMLPSMTIEVIDSQTVCSTLGSLVLYAQRLVAEGHAFQIIVDKIKEQIPKTAVFFSVDNLEALARGGRIGKARALIGKVLGIRPVMSVRNGSGEIEVVDKTRSPEAASALMVKLIVEHMKIHGYCQQITVVYAANTRYRDMLLDELRKQDVKVNPILQGRIGAVIGTHLGPTGWGITIC
jgi:fatty acid kinase fatty acid binding subunit